MNITCPSCQTVVPVDDVQLGKLVPCPTCHEMLAVIDRPVSRPAAKVPASKPIDVSPVSRLPKSLAFTTLALLLGYFPYLASTGGVPKLFTPIIVALYSVPVFVVSSFSIGVGSAWIFSREWKDAIEGIVSVAVGVIGVLIATTIIAVYMHSVQVNLPPA